MHLQFFGATGEVTGSCFLLDTGHHRVLIDCGLIQGSRSDEARNREPFPFNVNRIDAVVLTHAHLDHSGRLPLLVKAGYKGPIYTQRATRDLCTIMLKDAAYLNEKEAEWENRKRRRKGLEPVEPLYVMRDASTAMRRFRALDYGAALDILPDVRIRLQDAGHILGAAIVEMWVRGQGLERKIVFSGDLGHRGAPVLRDPMAVEDADLVVMESTYGDRLHRSWEQTWEEMADVFREALAGRGNILVPAFAVGRTQDLLYAFNLHYDHWGLDRWTVFLDSPMAIEATDVYSRHPGLYDRETAALQRTNGSPFGLPNLHLTRTAKQSMAINRFESGAVILAGSGMCEGGRIKHHLKHNIWRRNCHVVFVGYQAQGTLGRKLVDGAKHIRLWGETIRVAAKIHTVGGFSAHADQRGLLDWYSHFRNRPPVALVHGEPDAIDGLQERLHNDYQAAAHRAQRNMRYDLAAMKVADPGTSSGSLRRLRQGRRPDATPG
ncbi:MAG: MBL fold metallo-hydrolase [Gammaproteobacteria bacterium]